MPLPYYLKNNTPISPHCPHNNIETPNHDLCINQDRIQSAEVTNNPQCQSPLK